MTREEVSNSSELFSKDFIPTPEWINSTYFCKCCGREMECLKQIEWNVDVGVSRFGGCLFCNLFLFEYEKCPPKWVRMEPDK